MKTGKKMKGKSSAKKIESRKTAAEQRRERKEAENPYHITNQFTEKGQTTSYGCAFNQYVKYPKPQILATVTQTFLHLYILPFNQKTIEKRDSAEILLRVKDEFYTVAWCQQPSATGVPKTKLVVGGETGRMYVVDYETMEAEMELEGLGGMCNEIRTHPLFPTIIAVASNDQAVRVYDIRCEAPLLICGARNGHRDKSMSLDWSPDGKHIVDSGYDHKVFLWNIGEPRIVEHLKNAIDALDRGEQAPTVEYTDMNQQLVEEVFSPKKKALFIVVPEAFGGDVHFDSVDCIRLKVLKGQMYFVSRNCGNTPALAFWRFGHWDRSKPVFPETGEPNPCVTQLFRKRIDGIPVPYFMKFDVDADFRWCVVPGANGDVQFFSLRDQEATGPTHTTIVHIDQWLIRQVAFCDRSMFFVTVGDSGTITRFDKNRDPLPPVENKVKVRRKKENTAVRVPVEEKAGGVRAAEEIDDFVMPHDENTDPLIPVPVREEVEDDIEIVWAGKSGEAPEDLQNSVKAGKSTEGSSARKAPRKSVKSVKVEAPEAPEAPAPEVAVPAEAPDDAALNNQVEGMESNAEADEAEHPPDDEDTAEAAQNGSRLQNQEEIQEENQEAAAIEAEARASVAGNQEGGSEAVEQDRPNGAPGDHQAYRETGDGYEVTYADPTRNFHSSVKNTGQGPPVPSIAPYTPEDYEMRDLPDNVNYVRIEEINEEEAENVVQQEMAPHDILVDGKDVVGQEDIRKDEEEPARQEANDDEDDDFLDLQF